MTLKNESLTKLEVATSNNDINGNINNNSSGRNINFKTTATTILPNIANATRAISKANLQFYMISRNMWL